MMEQTTIAHFSAWASLCSSIIAIPGILLAATSGPRAREHVSEYQEKLSQPSFFGRAFTFSYLLSTALFGPRLLSWRAFGWGFAISVITLLISSGLIILFTIPPMEDTTLETITPLFTFSQILSIVATTLLTLFALCFEFIYVVKSRYLLRFLHNEMPWYFCLGIGALDLVSTYVIFVVTMPIFLIAFYYIATLPMTSFLNPDYLVIDDSRSSKQFNVSGHPIPVSVTFFGKDQPDRTETVTLPNTSLSKIYEVLFLAITDGALAHFRERFTRYHGVSMGRTLKQEYWVPWSTYIAKHPDAASEIHHIINPKTGEREDVDIHIDPKGYVGTSVQANFALTSMLITASSTTIWVGCCVVILVIMRCIQAPKSSYVWIADHHQAIWVFVIFPCLVIFLIGIWAIFAGVL